MSSVPFRREQPVQPGFQVAQLDSEQEQPRRRRPRRSPEPVTCTRVDPLLLAVARDMTGGDPSKYRIISVGLIEVQTDRGTVPVERARGEQS